MAEQIRVEPGMLREAAGHHEETADYLRTMPSSHASIQESLDSLGPIFGDLREAGRELLEQRRQCYERQADGHASMSRKLLTSARMWEEHDAGAAQQFKDVGGA